MDYSTFNSHTHNFCILKILQFLKFYQPKIEVSTIKARKTVFLGWGLHEKILSNY